MNDIVAASAIRSIVVSFLTGAARWPPSSMRMTVQHAIAVPRVLVAKPEDCYGHPAALARGAAERERLAQMFEKVPSFMALLRGPDHVFELVNPVQARLIGHRDVLGKAVRQPLPELEGAYRTP